MRERDALEELNNIVRNYPVFAGHTISHQGARACQGRGWIERNRNGDWIPTAEGLRRHAEEWNVY